MLFSYTNKRIMSDSLMSEIFGDDEVRLTLKSETEEVFKYLDFLCIPYKNHTIEEVLEFLYDRILYEYMENQTCYSKETFIEFKKTIIYKEIQILIYHLKKLLLWLYDENYQKMPRTSRLLMKKSDINPEQDTVYIVYYEQYRLYMSLVVPDKLVGYFNSLVGLKHLSVRTKAIYHAFVEEIERRNFDYDDLIYSKEKMLSYFIEVSSNNNKFKIIKKE